MFNKKAEKIEKGVALSGKTLYKETKEAKSYLHWSNPCSTPQAKTQPEPEARALLEGKKG